MNEIKEFFNKLAPSWNECEKWTQKMIFEFISRNLPLKKGDRVLDIGCGTGIIDEALYEMTETQITAIDISSEMIKIAKETHDNEHIYFCEQDFYGYDGKNFDALVCFNAYPHFTDIKAFVNKAAEVLKTGGICAIIHNLSREALTKCHESKARSVSRAILPAEKEAEFFKDKFVVKNLSDDDEKYLIILEKKK